MMYFLVSYDSDKYRKQSKKGKTVMNKKPIMKFGEFLKMKKDRTQDLKPQPKLKNINDMLRKRCPEPKISD